MKRRAVVWLMPLVFTGVVQAETRLHFGGFSYHLMDRDKITNENHRLLGVEHKGLVGAYFRNSFDTDSFLLGYRFRYRFAQDWEASLIAGATYGYSSCSKHDDIGSKEVCPALIPAVTYTEWAIEPSLLLMGPALTAEAAYRF